MTSFVTQSKQEKIDQVKANLPLPEQPPKPSDWQSANANTVNVGSGRSEAERNIGTDTGAASGLRGPASKDTVDLEKVGRQAVEGELPKDASY
ncbi:Conserved hypothetical, protein [Geosmithia morbida]|uniref:Conserved hypothetical, protein n=1 Tax=Geosmithia morbida TaxID=1094350 RepID=A0A9P5D7C7_9HYPO|nr:Conserved hypothetical, protein [Geosmithia morbida]KAF4125660.1 Conserved hypothetical, protein [Geosmithia morbida]